MDQIGRYQILDELGRGAMGVVYRAQDPAIGRIIAIKTIRLSDLTDTAERDRLRDRLFREAQSAGILSHPNIVTIYDVAEENGLAYIFMEYVDGPAFEKALSSTEPPTRDQILSFLRQTALALDYAHRKGIVHRDIKPANILIHDGNQAKITDFGVARISSQQMTQAGTMMGTPNYMSPEQVQGHPVDGRADQFALAVIAYEVLTGEKPFIAEYLPTLLYKIVREDAAPPQRVNPTLGHDVEPVFRKALAKNPEERYPTCVEFMNDLESALSHSPGWQPLSRGTSQSMPTVAGTVSPYLPAPVVLPPPRPIFREEAPERSTLVRNVVSVLILVGLLGLVLLAAQKYIFTTPAPPAAASNERTPARAPTPETAQTPVERPNPFPAESPVVKAETPADSTPKPAARTPPVAEMPTQSAKGAVTVQFITTPAGAAVTVDGNGGTCTTPCTLPLDRGRHTMTADLNGYRAYPKVFNVPEQSDVFLPLVKSGGTLAIHSIPPGATIEIDGKEQAQHTPATISVEPGTYHVRVSKDGVPLDFDVDIKDGEFKTRNVTFQ